MKLPCQGCPVARVAHVIRGARDLGWMRVAGAYGSPRVGHECGSARARAQGISAPRVRSHRSEAGDRPEPRRSKGDH